MPALVVPEVHDDSGDIAKVGIFVERGVHRIRGQPVVGSLHDQSVHLQQAQSVDDRGMRVRADDHPQVGRPSSPSRRFVGLAGDREGRQVAGRPARYEAPAGAMRQSGLVGDERSTVFSAAIAPDASSQEMPWIEAHETSMSNNRLALVGAAGMKPRNRGLSAEMMLGAITDE